MTLADGGTARSRLSQSSVRFEVPTRPAYTCFVRIYNAFTVADEPDASATSGFRWCAGLLISGEGDPAVGARALGSLTI